MYLAAEMYLAPVGQRSVLLDLEKDRFVGLGPQTTEIVAKALDGQEFRPQFAGRLEARSPSGERLYCAGASRKTSARRHEACPASSFDAAPDTGIWNGAWYLAISHIC